MGEELHQPSAPAVLVLAYGKPDLLRHCLETVGGDVVVVDNGRDDATRTLCNELSAHYVRPSENLGFAAGVNLGLRVVGPGRDVLLLNSDALLTPEALSLLHRELDHGRSRRLAAVAPTLRRPDGEVERTEWPVPSPAGAWAGVIGRRIPRRRGRLFLSGAVLLLSAEAIAAIGDFDERFFLYCEETDWQVRALAAGWGVSVVPDAHAVHLGAASSTSTDVREALFHGSAELFVRKWYGPAGWQIFRAGSLLAAVRRLLSARSRAHAQTQLRLIRRLAAGPARDLPRVVAALR